MNAFEYATPATKEQAISLLGNRWGETEVLAGGTDLLSLMKDSLSTPKRVVNIKNIREFQGIHYSPSAGLQLGALVTFEELLDSPIIKKEYPSLLQAAEGVRSLQLRNLGTVGGDLCQRPRCWYFRSGLGYFPKTEDGKDLIPLGENQYHAIFGNSGPSYFVSPSSLAPALIVLDARIRIFGSSGWRVENAERFFTTPKIEGERETVLRPNEIVGEILVPPTNGIQNSTYEVRQKEALDWPLTAAAVSLRMSGQKILNARVVMGHVAPVPWRSQEAEKMLAGKTASEAVAIKAGEVAVIGARPLSKNSYKVQLARVAVKRAILGAARGGK